MKTDNDNGFPKAKKKSLTGTAVMDETFTDPLRLKRNIVKL